MINTAPAFFVSKYQLLANHGNMNGGPWYICRVAANNEITIDSTAYGVPGQESSEAAGGLRAVNSVTASPPDSYNEEEDPESDGSDLTVCFAPAFTTIAFAPDPRAAEFNPVHRRSRLVYSRERRSAFMLMGGFTRSTQTQKMTGTSPTASISSDRKRRRLM